MMCKTALTKVVYTMEQRRSFDTFECKGDPDSRTAAYIFERAVHEKVCGCFASLFLPVSHLWRGGVCLDESIV